MGQRNMLCTSQMNDMEIDQQAQGYLCPEPCFLLGGMTNFRQPNIHTMVTSSGNTSNLDMHHFPEPYEGAVFYGMPQYIRVQDHHPAANLDLAVPAAPNFYNAYVAPSSSAGLIPVPLNHGSAADQLPSSSNYAAYGVPADSYVRTSQPMGGVGGPYKRKHAEGIPGSFQYYNSSASSSSSVAPFNTRHPEGVAIMDAVSFGLPQFRGNGMMMEAGSQRSVRNGLGPTAIDAAQVHGHNPLVQGTFIGQPFQPSGTRWVDQHISSNSSGGGAPAWTQAPAIPYMHGSNINGGYVENGGMAMQGYHETATNRSSSSFVHPPNHPHFNIHYPSPPPVQGMRAHNVNIYPQVLGTSHRLPTNTASRNMINLSHDGLEVVDPRHPRPVPPTVHSIYRPHRGGDIPETTLRYRNLPHLRVLPADEVAILELPEFYEAGNFVDNHRDMRMDIEDMTYEDLLALGERIGNVSTGLSEEDIVKQMKTRTYKSSSAALINLEEAAPSVDEESDSCIICQADYINKEKIGTLGCGHEYHADCLKKWLLVKNVCPICKSEALSTGRKQSREE